MTGHHFFHSTNMVESLPSHTGTIVHPPHTHTHTPSGVHGEKKAPRTFSPWAALLITAPLCDGSDRSSHSWQQAGSHERVSATAATTQTIWGTVIRFKQFHKHTLKMKGGEGAGSGCLKGESEWKQTDRKDFWQKQPFGPASSLAIPHRAGWAAVPQLRQWGGAGVGAGGIFVSTSEKAPDS